MWHTAVTEGSRYAAMGAVPSPTKWGRRAVVSSIYQHAIYAVAAAAAFELLQGRARWSTPPMRAGATLTAPR